MGDIMQQARIYQILALNTEMLNGGHISQEEYNFIRHTQMEKLTNLNQRSKIEKGSNEQVS